METKKEARRKAEKSLANKETELAFAKQTVGRKSKKAKEKLKAAEEEVKKLKSKLGQEKDQHRQTINSKKELEDKQ